MTQERDSIVLFGGMDIEADEGDPNLTLEQKNQVLLDSEAALRKVHFNDIQNKRKFGEVLYNAKFAVGSNRFMEWIKENIQLYLSSEGELGFWIGNHVGKDKQRTVENYINMYLLAFHHSKVYEAYRHFPDWILYQVASYTLNDKDPETLPVIKRIRAKNAGQITDRSGVPDFGLPADYPALIEMCESGELSQIRAFQIVDECSGDMPRSVVDVVKHCGIRGVDEVRALCDVDDSIMRAIADKQTYNNMFAEAMNTAETGGWVTNEDGDQVLLRDLSAREIWKAHIRGRYQGSDGGGSGGSKWDSLYDNLIKHDDALTIARDLGDKTLIASIKSDTNDTSYKLTLKSPV